MYDVHTMGDLGGFDEDLGMAGLEDGIIDAFLAIDRPDAPTLAQAAQQTSDPLLRQAKGLPVDPGNQGQSPTTPSGIGVPSPGRGVQITTNGGSGPSVAAPGPVSQAIDLVSSAPAHISGILDGTISIFGLFNVDKKIAAAGAALALVGLGVAVHHSHKKKGGARRRRG